MDSEGSNSATASDVSEADKNLSFFSSLSGFMHLYRALFCFRVVLLGSLDAVGHRCYELTLVPEFPFSTLDLKTLCIVVSVSKLPSVHLSLSKT